MACVRAILNKRFDNYGLECLSVSYVWDMKPGGFIHRSKLCREMAQGHVASLSKSFKTE